MGGARAWARSIRRRRWGALAVLALLGGLGLGLVLLAATGAHRARTAYDRLYDANLGPDAFLDPGSLDDATVEELAALPGVEGLGRFSMVPVAPAGAMAGGFAALDPDVLDTVLRPVVLDGRLAEPAATDEVVVNEQLADAMGYRPGDRITLQATTGDGRQLGDATVVGIVRTPFDVGPTRFPLIWLSSTAFAALPDALHEDLQTNALVRLTDGGDGIDAFQAAASELLGQPVQVQGDDDNQGSVEDTLGVQASGYWLLAAVAALATVLAVGQGLARTLGQGFTDLPTLRAIGLRPRERVLTGTLLVVPSVVASLLLGLLTAWLVSDRILTAFARSVDPARGRHLDAPLTAGLAATWLVLAFGLGALLAWREGRRRDPSAAPPRRWLPRPAGLRSRLGVDAALRSPGRPGGAAARSALLTASIGVAGLAAVAVFGASLSHLFATPRLQGWEFDAVVQAHDPVPPRQFRAATADLAADPVVEHLAYADLAAVSFGGRMAETVVVADGHDPAQPTIRAGRAAVADDEVVLGTRALARTGADVGATITAEGPAGTRELTIVGTAVYPMLGNETETDQLATITRGAAQALGVEPMTNMVFVDLAPGHRADELASYGEQLGGEAIGPFENISISNLRQVRAFPWWVGAFFALVAIVTIAHGILRSVSIRRREFAELTALGLTRRDRRRIVAAQGLTVAVVAVVVGLVLGTAAGQWGWSLLAGALGVVDEPVVPAAALTAVAVGTAAVCLVTAVAAPRLVRLRPARDLRVAE